MKHLNKLLATLFLFGIVPYVSSQTLPNFQIQELEIEVAEIEIGESLGFSYKLVNSGGNAPNNFWTGVFISTTPNGENYTNNIFETGLGEGEVRATSTAVTIPNQLAPGIYYLRLKVDLYSNHQETNENDNYSQAIPFLIKEESIPADVLLTEPSISTTAVTSGDEIDFNTSVLNTGEDDVDGVSFRVYISADDEVSESDIELFASNTPYLTPGASEEYSNSLFMPEWSSESAYLIFIVDKNDELKETNEQNNRFTISLQFEITQYDFTILEASLSSPSVKQGESVSIEYTIQNIGSRSLNPPSRSLVTFHISQDDTYDNGFETFFSGPDPVISGFYMESNNVSGLQHFNINQAPGVYTLFIVANTYNDFTNTRENNYNNNLMSFQITVLEDPNKPDKPELSLESLVLEKSTIIAGNSLNVTATALNTGTGSANSFDIDIVLDTDKDPDNGFYDLLKSYNNISLNSGQIYNINTSVFIPESVPAQNYYVQIRIDSDDDEMEAVETNNTLSEIISVQPIQRDLILQELIFDKKTIKRGDEVSLKALVYNNSPVFLSDVLVQVAISQDDILDESDIFLADRQIDIASEATSLESFTVTIPDNGLEGNHYLFTSVNYPSGDYSEPHLANNYLSKRITLVGESLVSNLEYCESSGNTVDGEYITRVRLNTLDNQTPEPSLDAYEDFTSLHTTLNRNGFYTLTINSENSGFSEGYSAWIDFNQDGDFEDANEQLFTKSPSTDELIERIIHVPATAVTGVTRLRVSMEYSDIPGPCGNLSYGEVEDYSIIISNSFSRVESKPKETQVSLENFELKLYPNPTNDFIKIKNQEELKGQTFYMFDQTGKMVLEGAFSRESIDVRFLPAGMYLLNTRINDKSVRIRFMKQ